MPHLLLTTRGEAHEICHPSMHAIVTTLSPEVPHPARGDESAIRFLIVPSLA